MSSVSIETVSWSMTFVNPINDNTTATNINNIIQWPDENSSYIQIEETKSSSSFFIPTLSTSSTSTYTPNTTMDQSFIMKRLFNFNTTSTDTTTGTVMNDFCTSGGIQRQLIIDSLISIYNNNYINTIDSSTTDSLYSTNQLMNDNNIGLYKQNDLYSLGDAIVISSEQYNQCEYNYNTDINDSNNKNSNNNNNTELLYLQPLYNTIQYINEQVMEYVTNTTAIINPPSSSYSFPIPLLKFVIVSENLFNSTYNTTNTAFTTATTNINNAISLSLVVVSNDSIQYMIDRGGSSSSSSNSSTTNSFIASDSIISSTSTVFVQPFVFTFDSNNDGIINSIDFCSRINDYDCSSTLLSSNNNNTITSTNDTTSNNSTSTNTNTNTNTNSSENEYSSPTGVDYFLWIRLIGFFLLIVLCSCHHRRQYVIARRNGEVLEYQLQQQQLQRQRDHQNAYNAEQQQNKNSLSSEEFDTLLIHTTYNTITTTSTVAPPTTKTTSAPNASSSKLQDEQSLVDIDLCIETASTASSTNSNHGKNNGNDIVDLSSIEEGRATTSVGLNGSTHSLYDVDTAARTTTTTTPAAAAAGDDGNINSNSTNRFDKNIFSLWSISNATRNRTKQNSDNSNSNNNDDNDEDTHCCSICLDEIQENDIITTLPKCKHWFHKDCIREWVLVKQSDVCPLCKTQIK